MADRIPVVVLGATGSVGQRFVQLLDSHPWFKVVGLTGSERTIGMVYGDACRWILAEPMPGWAKEMKILPSDPSLLDARVAFSAMPSGKARQVEPVFAQAGVVVCSNASAFRTANDVPILLPEVNPDHIDLIHTQHRQRGWTGCIVTNPNCTSTGLTVVLKALQDAFGVRMVIATSLQALSGAGYPGVASMDILDNVVPYIEGEEGKVEWEPRKMLGNLKGDAIQIAEIPISAHTNRVAVSDGHLVCASIGLRNAAGVDEVITALRDYRAPAASRDLPSAPRPPIVVRMEPDRPQPRLDRQTGGGMCTVVGRVRADSILDLKMVILSHNTMRGAAGGSIYNAELLVERGLLGR